MKKKNYPIALYAQSLEGGGAEKMIVLLANSLASKGLKVQLIIGNLVGPYVKLVSPDVEVFNLQCEGVLKSAVKLGQHLGKQKCDVLFSTMTGGNISALICKFVFRLKFRLVISERSITSKKLRNGSKVKNNIIGFLIKILYARADSIIAISEGVKDDLIKNFGINPLSIHVIYNMVNIHYDGSFNPDNLYKNLFGGEEKVPVVISVARLVSVKNYPLLIKAFSILRRKRPCKLLILGTGPEYSRIVDLVNEEKISDDVKFFGFADNPIPYMEMADVLVLSSNWEGFGNVLIEALSVGTPVVSTDCESGPREILENGKWGKLVSKGDPDELAEAIDMTLNEANLFDLKERARHFSVNKITEEYRTVLGV